MTIATDQTKGLLLTRHLPVKLDQYRERVLHTQQTEGRIEELRLTEHLKNVNDSVKQLIKDEQKKQTDAARALHAGFEHALVACRQIVDFDHNTVRIIREDTGETIETRALESKEREQLKKKSAMPPVTPSSTKEATR